MCLPEAVMNDMLSITQRQREAFMNMLTGAKRANLVEQSRQKTAQRKSESHEQERRKTWKNLNSKTGEVSLNDNQLLGVNSIQIKMDMRKDEKGHIMEFAEATLVMDTQEQKSNTRKVCALKRKKQNKCFNSLVEIQ